MATPSKAVPMTVEELENIVASATYLDRTSLLIIEVDRLRAALEEREALREAIRQAAKEKLVIFMGHNRAIDECISVERLSGDELSFILYGDHENDPVTTFLTAVRRAKERDDG